MTLDIDQQIERISRGATEVLPLAELKAKLKRSISENRPLQVKLGLDPTAPDIHIGNAVVLRKLRQFQDMGHEVTVIIGDFTATIGDPTGKSETRKQLTQEEVAANAKTYADQYHKILDPAKTRVVFNSEWLGKLGLYEIVTLLAKTTVARILERDDFDKRFRSGLPIHTHEMLYPICQGYDSVYLKSDIEIGGTEQRFNIMMGRDLQREHGIEPQIALFMPLLVGLDGVDKMSKSKGNAIGIDEPPFEMFGKIMSITDEMMLTYYELCTDVPMDEVKVLTDNEATHPNLAKKRLAREIIALYHGSEAALAAEAEWNGVHVTKDAVPDDAPEVILSADKLDENGAIRIAALVTLSGLVPSSGEAKRVVQQGGVSVSGEKFSDPGQLVAVKTGQVLKVGKNRFARLTVAAG
ncbi:MAG: tyrosine--tRNA ligase [Capsulimonas sp.]|jgi:tyrosyl-tRNA synthetase|uniref:tyrosine--tRNA ligase n=1 Tax=Capsulimonas sp. TaxID=2494211 RepID=UPI0032663831|nr:tyrosyl-tRNA synthetase [Capsulimonas sp.]